MGESISAPGTVLVTGAARRIGRAVALDFAARRWRVAVHCHNSVADAEALAREIVSSGSSAQVLRADLSDQAAVEALIPQCAAGIGAPTCLINNASMFLYDGLPDLDSQQWDAQIAVNLKAPVFLSQSFARHLPPDAVGNIINILDQRVLKPTPHFFSYAVAKSALWSATQTLAQTLAPRIRVNAIGPGPVLASPHQSPGQFERQSAATLLQRSTSPSEVAAAIRFILDAPAMTGQMIALDGGQHLAWQTPDVLATAGKG